MTLPAFDDTTHALWYLRVSDRTPIQYSKFKGILVFLSTRYAHPKVIYPVVGSLIRDKYVFAFLGNDRKVEGFIA